MAWTNISNALVSVGALPFATTIQALRDNPIAIANGDAGAPRVQTNGIADSAVTTAKIAANERMNTGNVLGQTAGASVGAVGSYAFAAINASGITVATGSTRAGGDLLYATAGATFGSPPPGTWRNMGASVTGVASPGPAQTTLWLRIS
jgi:hypothetical protein